MLPKHYIVAISGLIEFLVSQHFHELNSVTIVYETSNETFDCNLQHVYLDAIEDALRKTSFIVQWLRIEELTEDQLNLQLLMHVEKGLSDSFIVISKDIARFIRSKYYATLNATLRLRDRKFLFVSFEEDLEGMVNNLNKIVKLYPNHLFLKHKTNRVEMHAQKAFGQDSVELTLLDIYWLENCTLQWNTKLYSKVGDHLDGQVIKVGAHSIPPFLFGSVVKPGLGNVDSVDVTRAKKSILYDGAESLIFLQMCKMMNCTLRIRYYGTEAWGDIFPNGSSYGLYGGLYNEEVDVGHGLLLDIYSEKFEFSASMTKIACVLLTPKPMRYAPYLTMVLPFNKLLWIVLLISIFFCILFGYWFEYMAFVQSKCTKPSQSKWSRSDYLMKISLRIIAIYFQISSDVSKYQSNTTRIFTGFLLFSTLIIENSYSGQLKSLLTVPLYMDPIDTTEKLIRSDLKWAGPVNKWVLPIVLSDLRRDQIISEKFEIMNHAQLKAVTSTGHYGLPVGKSYVYNFGDYIRDSNLEDFIRVKDDIFFSYSKAVAKKGWPLMEQLNTVIQWTLENGLYMHWENKFADKYLDAKTQRMLELMEVGNRDKDSPVKLKISNISGPLFILAFGLIVASLVFIAELVSTKGNCRKHQK